MATIGERIEAARKAKGLTQAELGLRVGLSTDKICKIETGTRKVSSGELFKLASVTGVRYEDLLRDRLKVAYRNADARSEEEIDAGMAVVDRFIENWFKAKALEEAFL